MECPGFRNCTERRVEESAQRARIDQKLINIEAMFIEMKENFKEIKQDFKGFKENTDRRVNRLYVKIGGISGGIVVIGFILEKIIFK